MSKIHKLLYALILFSLSSLNGVNAGEFSVVVNKNVRFTGADSEKTTFVKRLFLKKQTSWPSGIKAKPVNYKPDSPEYKAFVERILGMDESEINSHWVSTRTKSGATPPSGVGSYRAVLKLVGRSKGGVGYIDNVHLDDLPDTVKVFLEY